VWFDDVDALVVMSGFGFMGALLVGVVVVKVLVLVLGKLLYGVNYLVVYVVVDQFEYGLLFELIIVFLVFGGYFLLLFVFDVMYDVWFLGLTIDDVVGEVFDKVVWLFGLFFFGGFYVDCVVCEGDLILIVFL